MASQSSSGSRNYLSQADRQKAERFLSHLEPIRRQLSVYCVRALHQPDEAADALQSAVAAALRDFDRYAEGTNFRAWMFRYLTFEILNRNRAAGRMPSQLTPEQSETSATVRIDDFRVERLLEEPEGVLDHCDDLVARCVNDLTDQERRVFLLRAVGEFKYREIAEILEIPLGTVMGLLSRSRTQLRDQLLGYARELGLLSRSDRA